MLNVYKYYEHPQELSLYDNLGDTLELLAKPQEWENNEKTKQLLAPVLHIIKRSPESAYNYAKRVLEERWLEAEPTIAKNAETAVYYLLLFIRGRWPDAEPAIMKSPDFAFQYAKKILSRDREWLRQDGHELGRWPEAEQYIKQNWSLWYEYCEHFELPEDER